MWLTTVFTVVTPCYPDFEIYSFELSGYMYSAYLYIGGFVKFRQKISAQFTSSPGRLLKYYFRPYTLKKCTTMFEAVKIRQGSLQLCVCVCVCAEGRGVWIGGSRADLAVLLYVYPGQYFISLIYSLAGGGGVEREHRERATCCQQIYIEMYIAK